MRSVQRDEVRRNEVHHDARTEYEEFMPEVVAAEKFGTCKLVCHVKPSGEVGECGKARNGVRDAGFNHEADEAERASRNLEEVRMERLRDAVEERGERCKDHRKRDELDAFNLEVEKGEAHDYGIRNRVQQFRDEQPLPEFSADEVPVEKRMLEHESERKNQFAVKNGMVVAECECESGHEECGSHGRK